LEVAEVLLQTEAEDKKGVLMVKLVQLLQIGFLDFDLGCEE